MSETKRFALNIIITRDFKTGLFLLVLWQAAKAGVEITSGGTIGKSVSTQAHRCNPDRNEKVAPFDSVFCSYLVHSLCLPSDVIMLVFTVSKQNKSYQYGSHSQLFLGMAPSGPVLFVIVSLFPFCFTFTNCNDPETVEFLITPCPPLLPKPLPRLLYRILCSRLLFFIATILVLMSHVVMLLGVWYVSLLARMWSSTQIGHILVCRTRIGVLKT